MKFKWLLIWLLLCRISVEIHQYSFQTNFIAQWQQCDIYLEISYKSCWQISFPIACVWVVDKWRYFNSFNKLVKEWELGFLFGSHCMAWKQDYSSSSTSSCDYSRWRGIWFEVELWGIYFTRFSKSNCHW